MYKGLFLLILLFFFSLTNSCDEGFIQLSNGTCEFIDDLQNNNSIDKCKDYCQKEGVCRIVNNIPQCECKENTYGLTCSYTNDTIDSVLPTIFNIIVESNESNTISLDNDNNKNERIAKIRSLSAILVQNPTAVNKFITEDSLKEINAKTKATLKRYKNIPKETADKYIFDLLNLSLLLHVNYLENNKSLRQLEDEQTTTTKDDLDSLVEDAKYLSKNHVNNLNDGTSYIESTDITGSILYQSWKNNDEGNRLYKLSCRHNSLTYADFSLLSDAYWNTQVNFNSKFTSVLGLNTQTVGYPITLNEKHFQIRDFLPSYISLPLMDDPNFNADLYKYYNEKGIDIYNHRDKAFTDSCYKNSKLHFDPTQKYRKKYLFQNYTFGAAGCFYSSYNEEVNGVKFYCNGTKIPTSYIMVSIKLPGDINHVDNLPTKCAGDVEDIEENIAFWLFLVLFVVIIILDILFAVTTCKKLIKEDEVYQTEFNQVKTTEQAAINPTTANQVNVEIVSFSSVLGKNFKQLHPLLSLCNSSLLSPFLFNSWILLYNILCLFGFNALYFNETMLEDRIYDKHRDNFGYPMKTEFEKIMSAIATTIALTFIVRLIALITYDKKEHLLNNKDREEIMKGIMIRRIISGIFMLILAVFFFYYCVVFCGIYVNAQYGWFYSGIWALLWNWIAYAPIYIIIISLVEANGGEKCSYYMKRLFVF